MSVNIANTYGALEIGSSVTVFLLGIVTLQVHEYFQRFPRDKRSLHALVVTVWLLELGHTTAVAYEVFRTTIVLVGLPTAQASHPAIGAIVIIGTYIATIVQMFFCFRVHRVTPKPYNIVGPATAFIAFARAVLVTYCGVQEIRARTWAEYISNNTAWVMALLAMGAVIDIIICMAMMYFLLGQRQRALVRNARIIDRLIGFTLRTGLITSIVAVVVIILYGVLPTGNLVFFAVYTSLSKLYTNSLLSGFNGRPSKKDDTYDVQRHDASPRRFPEQESVSIPYEPNPISIEMKTTTDFHAEGSFVHPGRSDCDEHDEMDLKR